MTESTRMFDVYSMHDRLWEAETVHGYREPESVLAGQPIQRAMFSARHQAEEWLTGQLTADPALIGRGTTFRVVHCTLETDAVDDIELEEDGDLYCETATDWQRLGNWCQD
jgi:hypothetical protein